ncbi:hypothetical protein LTR50_005070 [Elasticomyces elasticus]|nr:hypothetical protein LTR50_005070 [Elasticomyces elasticus]
MAFPDGPQQSSVDITAAFDAYMRQPETTPSKTFEEFLRNAGCGDASPSGVTGSKRKEAPKAGGHDDVHAAPNGHSSQKKSSRRVAPAALTLRDQPSTNSTHSNAGQGQVAEQTNISDNRDNEYSDWVIVERVDGWVVVQGQNGNVQG